MFDKEFSISHIILYISIALNWYSNPLEFGAQSGASTHLFLYLFLWFTKVFFQSHESEPQLLWSHPDPTSRFEINLEFIFSFIDFYHVEKKLRIIFFRIRIRFFFEVRIQFFLEVRIRIRVNPNPDPRKYTSAHARSIRYSAVTIFFFSVLFSFMRAQHVPPYMYTMPPDTLYCHLLLINRIFLIFFFKGHFGKNTNTAH